MPAPSYSPLSSALPTNPPTSISAHRPRRLLFAALSAAILAGSALPSAATARRETPPPTVEVGSAPTAQREPLLAQPYFVDAATARKFEVALYRAKEKYGFHSVELAVLTRDGRTWSGVRGPRPATPFVVGSVTKTFVAALTLQLAEEGKFRLEDRVSQHMGRFASGVTIRQLLSHTSGIADLYNPSIRRVLSKWPNAQLEPIRVLRNVGSRNFAPGRGYAYSNTNYLLLGMLIERVTGNSLEREIQARFLDPLNMGHTTVLAGKAQSPRLSRGWASAFWASGNMTSTARDLVNWGQALYGTRLHANNTVREMLRFGKRSYGLGAQKLWVGGRAFPGHSGLLGHDTTLLIWVPQKQVAIAVIVNRASSKVDDLLAYRHGKNPSLLQLAMSIAS